MHPSNVLSARPLFASTSDLMAILEVPKRENILVRFGSSVTEHMPKYLVAPVTLPEVEDDAEGHDFRISGFTSAKFLGAKPEIRSPLAYQPPEALLDGRWDKQSDIWSLGCTVRKT